MDVERALTYLPKINTHKLLERITPYYSMMGDINADDLGRLNVAISTFGV